MNRIKLYILLCVSSLALSACGGGGSGGSPVAANQPPADPNAFSLISLKSLAAGTTTYNLAGSDDTGIQYTASLTITNTPNVGSVNGKALTRVLSSVTLVNTTADPDVTTTSNGSSYYTSDYALSFIVDDDKNITCTPTSYQAPPDSAKVNDHQSLAVLTCADKYKVPTNTSINITWRLDAGDTNDVAKFVVTQKSYVAGNLDSTEIDSYIIDHAGNIKNVASEFTNKSGVIRTLKGL